MTKTICSNVIELGADRNVKMVAEVAIGPKDLDRIIEDYQDDEFNNEYKLATKWSILEETFEDGETAVYINLVADDGSSPQDTAFYDWMTEDDPQGVEDFIQQAREDRAYGA